MLNARGKVALFVGAGISVGCGLPDWKSLVDSLFDKAFDNPQLVKLATQDLSVISQTRLLRQKLGARFNYEVGGALYSQPYEISATVKGILNAGIRRICCYNFDDLIEESLRSEGKSFHSIVEGEAFNNNFRGTAVFHPHGYLPAGHNMQLAQDTKIILSEEDYNALYSGPYSWSNLVQLSLLMNYTCVFIGTSLQDPNVRRLLDTFASLRLTHWHYAVFKSPVYAAAAWDKSLNKQIKSSLEADLRSLKVTPVWINEHRELPVFLKNIRNKKESD